MFRIYFNLVLIQKICSRIHKKLNLEMFKSLMKTSQKFMTELNSGKFINATDNKKDPNYQRLISLHVESLIN